MELNNLPLYATIFFLIIPMLFIITTKSPNKNPKLPPGPMKLPIIGNLHNLVGQLPHHTLQKLSRKYGPLMHLKLGEVSTLIVSSPTMAKEFMKTHDLSFAQRPQLLALRVGNISEIDIAFAPYGNYWKQMRKICALELLSAKRVQSFSSIREEEIRNLVAAVRSASSKDSPVNLSDKFLEFTNSMFCRSAVGKKVDDRDASTLVSGLKEGNQLAAGFDLADLYPSKKFLEVVSRMRAKLEKIFLRVDGALQSIVESQYLSEIEERKESCTNGGVETTETLVHVLLRVQKSGNLAIPITIRHIKAVLADLFSAGIETTSTVLEWTMSELIKNPRVMEKAQAEVRKVVKGKKIICESDIQELSYLKLVIKEALRLHPPVPLLLPRECRESCIVNGYQIPTKTRVIINAWAIGRDPKYWDDPESFVPERFMGSSVDYKGTSFEYVPFGAGRRMCPGMSFGLTNVEIALAGLLYHFDWSVPNGMKPEDLDMTEVFGVTVVRKCNLFMLAVPYTPV